MNLSPRQSDPRFVSLLLDNRDLCDLKNKNRAVFEEHLVDALTTLLYVYAWQLRNAYTYGPVTRSLCGYISRTYLLSDA